MDIRIGVTNAPRELVLEMGDEVDIDILRADVDKALNEGDKVLWLTDRLGRQVAVPVVKIAYVEIGTDVGPRVGFASM